MPDIEVALIIFATSIPVSSLLMRLTFHGTYVSQREFDDFRAEQRKNNDSVNTKIDALNAKIDRLLLM